MEILAAFQWDPDPILFQIGKVAVRTYGLLFATGFLLSLWLVKRMFRREKRPEEDVETLLVWTIIGTIVGARLVHCLAYEPSAYLADPLSILRVWEGGLASHGGVLGIATALYLHSRRRPDQPFLWLLDRVAVVGALAGACVRIGNFFNAEIVGRATDVAWAVEFTRYDRVRGLPPTPRHPAQLYEALAYLLTFAILYRIYAKRGPATPRGLIVGWLFVLVFGARFAIEFVKERQAAWGSELPVSVGQLLSVPAILLGVWLVVRAAKRGAPSVEEPEQASA